MTPRRGRPLKVGKTTVGSYVARFAEYVTAGNRHHRTLSVDVYTLRKRAKKSIGQFESEIRAGMKKAGHRLTWDHSDRLPGQKGPGIPTPQNTKFRVDPAPGPDTTPTPPTKVPLAPTTPPARTTSGSIGGSGSNGRAPVRTPIRTGGGGADIAGAGVGVLTGIGLNLVPILQQRFAKRFLAEKWAAEDRAMIGRAVDARMNDFKTRIEASRTRIEAEHRAGRKVVLHVTVDTESIETAYGWAQWKAEVSYYTLLFEGDTPMQWPLFQPKRSAAEVLAKAPRKMRSRHTIDIAVN